MQISLYNILVESLGAQVLAQTAMNHGYSNPFIKSSEQQERLREASLSFGYHNGGLSTEDRSLIEGLFLNPDLQVLCTTNTLAHGSNLPAHTLIIKSTQYFNKEKGSYTEYDRSMILQDDMTIAKEEIFGPIISVLKF
ncbi:DExH-box ATP-dependent RNA helicase DExH17 isoform X1, partial [Tanacetum coccineum]